MAGKKMPDILGLAEVAQMANASKQAVSNWRHNSKNDFPKPYIQLKMGPIWYNQKEELEEWLKKRKT